MHQFTVKVLFCNVAARMRLAMKSKGATYPQPEGSLGDVMIKGGTGSLEDTAFGESRVPVLNCQHI